MTNIALLGFGTVGSGVAEVLTDNREIISRHTGEEIRIKYVLDLRDFPESPFGKLVVHDWNIILNDPEVSIVAEMMGGSHPAYEFAKAAILAKKHVVTSNKECVAKFGSELLALAAENGVRYLFEASVGGGIPVIRPIINDLAPVKIKSVSGILNGTTNYILSQMYENGADFGAALADAQSKGYAEKDPTADVEGLDAARKIVILSALACGKLVNPDDIYTEGISDISTADMKLAESCKCRIRLIASYSEDKDGKPLCFVCPRFVPFDNPLANVGDVNNGILIDTDMLGEVMFYGRGAGKLPTAGAVAADIADIAENPSKSDRLIWETVKPEGCAEMDSYVCKRVITLKGDVRDIRTIEKYFGKATHLCVNDGKISFITADMSEWDADAAVRACPLALVNKFRVL